MSLLTIMRGTIITITIIITALRVAGTITVKEACVHG
jgi:hypothetical protein